MKAKKLLALVMSVVMVLSMAAFSVSAETAVSVDFEDGNMGFVALYSGMVNADASTIELVDFNGGKGLKVTNGSGKVPYVAFDVWSLLGEAAANVRSIEMTMAIENPDGKFYACSGEVKLWVEDGLSKIPHGWSVYLPHKNPKIAVVALDEGEAFSAESPLMVVTLNTDNGAAKGAANANFFIDDIRFLDADGNVVAADSTAAFVAPNGFGGAKDMSNLKYLGLNPVVLEGMSGVTGSAWGQNGVDMTADFLAAMVPGAVVEIEYSSANGDIWVVMPDSAAGWKRINAENGATVNYNNSKNIAQISYEQFALVLGEDTSTWGARLQCEASGDWEIYSVIVGKDSGLVNTANKTLLDGSAITGGAWSQTDVGSAPEQWQALMAPGAVIEIQYTAANGDIWLVMPDSAAGWKRINPENGVELAYNGSVCQVTYEQMVSVLGEDVSTWGARIQCESSGDWEVYSISVCAGTFVGTANNTLLDGSAVTGGAWSQSDVGSAPEQWQALMVPGSVITIQYESQNGDIWLVMPDSAAGWKRINAENGVSPAFDGSVCQVTYEQMASVLGEDVSAWGARIQCEASGAWEVFSISVGTAAK